MSWKVLIETCIIVISAAHVVVPIFTCITTPV